MKLRDHPLIQRHNIPTWPPTWSNLVRGGGSYYSVKGEVGILKKVSRNSVVPNLCFIQIEHNGDSYAGALVVDNGVFCEQLVAILQAHVGRTIKEIGDLDLSITL